MTCVYSFGSNPLKCSRTDRNNDEQKDTDEDSTATDPL